MHANPVVGGLGTNPGGWMWSSFWFYGTGETGLVPIDPVDSRPDEGENARIGRRGTAPSTKSKTPRAKTARGAPRIKSRTELRKELQTSGALSNSPAAEAA